MESFRLLKWQKGVYLLEVLLSLGIVSVILLMATQYFFVVNRDEKVSIVRQQIGSLISGIESWKSEHSTDETVSHLSINTLLNEGFLVRSSFMQKTRAQEIILNNPWGHPIVIERLASRIVEISTELPSVNECRSLRNSYPDAEICYSRIFRFRLPQEGTVVPIVLRQKTKKNR